jgi:hypothetical protein
MIDTFVVQRSLGFYRWTQWVYDQRGIDPPAEYQVEPLMKIVSVRPTPTRYLVEEIPANWCWV